MIPKIERLIGLSSLTVQPSGQAGLAPSVWVNLAALPHEFSHSEALLLCQQSEDEWLAWVPDSGETVLHISEFYLPTAWN